MKRYPLVIALLFTLSIAWSNVLFYDDFNRTEGSAVANGWTNVGPVTAIIESGSLKITSNALQGVRRDFTSLGINSGIYYVSYDWKITSNNWLADAFPNGTITYLRHDYEGNLYYDNTSDFSDPIQIGNLGLNTWANFKLKVNLDTDRISVWLNNLLVVDNVAGLTVSDFTRFTFRAGAGSSVTQYIDNFTIYNEIAPAAPTALTATGAVNNVTLSWTGTAQQFLTYKIYRKTTSPADVLLAEVPATQTTYVDNTAAANTDYYYRVKAVSMSTIESGYSNEVTAHLQPDIAVTPQVINVTVGQGYTGTSSFTIENNGNYPLNYNISGLASYPTTGLAAHYSFDGTTSDTSGNNNNATPNGTLYSTDRFGNSNSAILIDDKTDYIDIPDFPSAQISVSMWYYFAGTGGAWNTLLCRNGEFYHHLLIKEPTYQIGFWNNSEYLTSALVLNQWVNLILIKNGVNSKLYLNGTLIQDSNLSFSNALYPLSKIGNYGAGAGGGQGALGKIDDVFIYNRVLSADEIQALSNPQVLFLSLSPQSGTIVNAGQTQINMGINPQNLTLGSYTDTLYINSNDTSTPSVPVIVNLTVAPGDIAVAPTEFTVKLNIDSNTSNTSFNINNTGLGKLSYSISGTDNYILNPNLPAITGFTTMGLHNGHSYYRSNSTMIWSDAKTICEQLGGHLATISSAEENSFIYQNTIGPSWLGFTDEVQEGVWRWVTNEPLSYINWYGTQPDNTGGLEDYGQIRWAAWGSFWNDHEGGYPSYAILEIDSAPTCSILSFLPDSGMIETLASQSIDMSVTGSIFLDGLYLTSARIISDAPEARDTIYIPVTVKVDYTPPLAPLGLSFDEAQSDMNRIYLSWSANALADSVYSYKVYRRGLHDTGWTLKGTVAANHCWFIDNQFTGLDTTSVYYKISAVDWVDNEGAASAEVAAWLQRFPAPTGLGMEIIRSRHVKLTWSPVTQTISGNPGTPSCYVIYRSNAPSPIEDFYFVGAVDATTFTHNWAAWFIENSKQFYVVTAYSGSFEDLRAVAATRRGWKFGELERVVYNRNVGVEK